MDSLPINILDLIVGAVILLSAFLAFTRGFVHEVMSIGGWVGAAFVTYFGFPHIRPVARDLIENKLIADIAAGIGIFIVSLVLFTILTRILSKTAQESGLNALDRSLGFLFGIARGAFIVCLLYLAADWMVPRGNPDEKKSSVLEGSKLEEKDGWPDWAEEARSLPVIAAGARFILTFIPEDVADSTGKKANDLKKKGQDALDAEKMIRGIIQPKPQIGDQQPKEGYTGSERKEMDRLFDSAPKKDTKTSQEPVILQTD